jgi:hypothetical protein
MPMIRNPKLFSQQAEQDRWNDLRHMTATESIAVGEALLTSEIMMLAEFADDDDPRSLALSLGIPPDPGAGAIRKPKG